ncbi:hypothetical protein AJ79_02218 [Helicocarpus griseus UAMH5409]|uniref:AB hydrolase-1 domain-containing protein n=1 Tax=Helicocarpus griseus UAMH5409 TaxID=1447875 RepID=A0A2B7Y597_9EURO|nr:hypothetical protein AJ79_02218 [Helicocarpus griseus UAMH5409]
MQDTMGPPQRADTQPDISTSRRKSLPSRSTSVPAHRHIPPASPEVISSLISSLSAISTPAQSHFENFPEIGSRTAPSSPGFQQTEFSRDGWDANVPSSPGFGMDYGAYKTIVDEDENPYLHPDDAAISPVVRMAKAPTSPRSPRTPRSPPGGDSRTGSRASMASSHIGPDDFSVFGVPSLEPGPRMSTASIASSSSGGRKSLKNQLNILKRASREFHKDKESDRFHKTGDNGRLNSPRSRLSLRSTPSMADLTEEVSLNNGVFQLLEKQLNEDSRRDSAPNLGTPRSIPDSGNGNGSPGGIGSGRIIPTRESSLRHSYHGNSSKKRRSARHSIYSNRDFTIDRDIEEVNAEDDQVSKRIKELKEQQKKIKDELETDETPEAAAQTRTPKPSPKPPVKHTTVTKETVFRQPAHTASDEPLKKVDELQAELEDSAPSPAVLTRKSQPSKKRNSGPLSSKTPNIQPVSASASFEKPDRNDPKVLRRRSLQNNHSESNHRRTRSGAISPGPRLSLGAEERPSSADSIDDAVREYMLSPRLTQKVKHPQTGRVIAFSEVGDPKGHVVFCCVGMGLTRYLTAFYDELARTLKLRLITPDRPGVGESEPCLDGSGTPLSWPDDVAIICNSLKITKFSMLAHSAGAIYALATALRMPQHIRGRIHLLAPWIPPSQMSSMGSHKEPLPASAVPYSQRILRALPTPFLKVANSSFMTTTSSSITSSLPKNSRRTKRRSTTVAGATETGFNTLLAQQRENNASAPRGPVKRNSQDVVSRATSNPSDPKAESAIIAAAAAAADKERQSDYDNRLTHAIWELATTNANPAVDLLVCLERRQTIGFRYVDINRAVVIHHGTRDTRVPVDNVRWLGKTMRRCEVRVLEGEGHGLMASALVMGNVLMEVAKEWEDWTTVVQGKREGGRRTTVTSRGRLS